MKRDVKQALAKAKDQAIASAEFASQEIADWQTIQEHLTRRIEGLQLTKTQQKKLDRYQFIYNQLVTGKYLESEIVSMVEDTYGLSYNQALRDLRDTKELFESAYNIRKSFEVHLSLELNKLAAKRALDMGDMKSYAAIEKNRIKLISLLPEDQTSLADEFAGRQNIITFNPELLGVKPFTQGELFELISELKTIYGGKIDTRGLDIQDAIEVKEDEA